MFKFYASIALVVALWGCTDFSGGLNEYYEPYSVEFQKDLSSLSCSSKNSRDEAVIVGENHGSILYTCHDGVWVGNQNDSIWYGVEYSSSSEEVSSSSSSSEGAVAPISYSTPVIIAPASSGSPTESSSSIVIAEPVSLYNLGSCTPADVSIDKGGSTTFKFTPNKVSVSGYEAMDYVRASYEWNYGAGEGDGSASITLASDKVTFSETGDHIVSVTVTMADGAEEKVKCSPLHVNGEPITGCRCSTDSATVDVSAGGEATWQIQGCTSNAGTLSFKWSNSMGTGHEASYAFTEKGQRLAPVVTVGNDDNTIVKVQCAEVRAVDSNNPDYEISETGSAGGVRLPAGTSSLTMNLPGDRLPSMDSFSMECEFETSENMVTVDGKTYSAGFVAFLELPYEHSYGGYVLEMELSASAFCWVAY